MRSHTSNGQNDGEAGRAGSGREEEERGWEELEGVLRRT